MYYLNKIFTHLRKDNSIIYGGIIFLFCIPFLYLTFFIHPSGDDYSYAFLELKSPFFKAYIDEYLLWNGRYASNAFVLKNPLTFEFNNVWLYRIIVSIIQIVFFLSILFIFNKTKTFFSLRIRVLVAGFFFLSYLVLIPSLNEGFYWYTGMVTYQIAVVLSLVYLNFYFGNFPFKILILVFLQFFIVGCNEIGMLYLILFHLFFQCISFKKNEIILLFTATIFGLVVILAPGNSIRSSYFEGVSHQFFHSFYMSFLQVFRFSIVLNSGLLLFTTSFLFYFKLPSIKLFIAKYSFKYQTFILPLILFGILFLSVFPAYWTTGIMGQHRTVNFSFFICIPTLFYWYLVIINRYEVFFDKVYKRIKKVTLFIFITTFFFTKNFKGVISDLSLSKHVYFDIENNERYKEIENQLSQNKKDVYLTKLKTRPFSISIYDLENDPNHLVNIGYQRYWKIHGKVFLNP